MAARATGTATSFDELVGSPIPSHDVMMDGTLENSGLGDDGDNWVPWDAALDNGSGLSTKQAALSVAVLSVAALQGEDSIPEGLATADGFAAPGWKWAQQGQSSISTEQTTGGAAGYDGADDGEVASWNITNTFIRSRFDQPAVTLNDSTATMLLAAIGGDAGGSGSLAAKFLRPLAVGMAGAVLAMGLLATMIYFKLKEWREECPTGLLPMRGRQVQALAEADAGGASE